MVHQEIKIYNSLSGQKEIFKPIVKGLVGIYACGPTVYSQVHMGNCRTFISFDLVVRYFRHLGYKTRYVRNITDIGHLEDEEGEDKVLKRARIEHLEPMELVHRCTRDFHNVLFLFNTIPPDIEPTAIGHISDQIKIIKKLIDKNIAYESGGSVYFDLKTYIHLVDDNPGYKRYGILSHHKIEELSVNTRILKGQQEKKNSQDFALWKKASEGHIMHWPSPWGEGFPGWHIECTSMSIKYLGEVFDIHAGGIDLKFPHHECELAQAQGTYGKNPVNYWMHANLLTLNGKKMSKSSGNIVLPSEIFSGENTFFKKYFSPEVVRFFILQTHYRSVLDFSNQALSASEIGYYRLIKTFMNLEKLSSSKKENEYSFFNVQSWRNNCYKAMNDDFNSPRLISHLFEICPLVDKILKGKEFLSSSDLNILKITMRSFFLDILGLGGFLNNSFMKKKFSLKDPLLDNLLLDNIPTTGLDKSKKLLDIILRARERFRRNKDWKFSDEIRDKLLNLGYVLRDNQDGTTTSIETYDNIIDTFK